MSEMTIAAIDLGAESGRIAAARFDGSRIELDIVARFPNAPHSEDGRQRWDIEALADNAIAGLRKLGANEEVASVGVDAWGVDFALLRNDRLLESPLTYRDAGRHDAMKRAIDRWGSRAFFQASGVQVLGINSIFALLDDVDRRPDLLREAELLLMIPDLLHRRLSGSSVTEYTVATTTGGFDVREGRWATGFLDKIGVPTHFLPEVIQPGTDIGALQLTGLTGGLARTRVIAPATHDTASAVVAIPRLTQSTMFISSGTWSLTGVLLDEPNLSPAALEAELANEGGYGGTIRFLRDIVGLWVLQECRRQWRRQGFEIEYDDLVSDLARVRPLVSVVDLRRPEFLEAGDMPSRIREACHANGMPVPETVGEVGRVVIDSLALAYRGVLEDLERITGTHIESIAVVGGGTKNAALQQATASATGRPVICWSDEATALGNAAVQLATLGELDGIDQIWDVVAASSSSRTYLPEASDDWEQAAARLVALGHCSTSHSASMPGMAESA